MNRPADCGTQQYGLREGLLHARATANKTAKRGARQPIFGARQHGKRRAAPRRMGVSARHPAAALAS